MVKVTIYTTRSCPYCHRAKALLGNKAVCFIEIDVAADPMARTLMRERAMGRHTVPQIFIDDYHVGGCDDLYELERQGRLDTLLGKA